MANFLCIASGKKAALSGCAYSDDPVLLAIREILSNHIHILRFQINLSYIRDFKTLTTDYEHAQTLRNTMDD